MPPNLLAIANTESNGVYQEYCRANGIDIHPARFPALLPEYFIRYLTDPGDLVVDPFGGSCVTGMVAEALGHAGFDWVVVDMEHTPLDLAGLAHMLQAISGTAMLPVTRVPWNA